MHARAHTHTHTHTHIHTHANVHAHTHPILSYSFFLISFLPNNYLAVLLQMLMNASVTMVDVPTNVSIWQALIVVSVLPDILFITMDMIAVSNYSYTVHCEIIQSL